MTTTRSDTVGRVSRGGGATGVALALALLCGGAAVAETKIGSLTLSGEAELGGRVVWHSGDEAKFEEYRDLVDGVIGNFDLLLENEEITHWLRGRGENVGYDDQRYWLEGGRYGLYEIEAFYGELPHIYSDSARTPYLRVGQRTFELPAGFNIAAPDQALFHDVPQEMTKWREGSFGTKHHLSESVLLKTSYRIQDKHGTGNWGMNFGSPGGTFTSIPRRFDERIHESRVGLDWQLGDASISVEYLGNFYDNQNQFVTAQNPNSPAQPGPEGRAATPPNNWFQSLSLAGAASLPLGVPNRVSANFAYGFRRQDDDFLPHTINPAFAGNPALVLPDSSLDGKVQTLLGNFLATVEPAEDLSAKLRYRIYDLDNQTDSLFFPNSVLNDGTLVTAGQQSAYLDYTRQNGDLDLAWDFAPGWTAEPGFGFEYWHRNDVREVEDLWDYGPSLKLDYRSPGGTLLHAGYQFRNRDGSSYDALAPIDAVHGPGEVCPGIATFCEVRKYDEADRYLNRFDLLGQFVPMEPVELTLTGNVDYSDYDQTDYGLTKAIGWHVGSDVYYQIHPRVGLLTYYTYEWRRFWQDSRQRSVAGGLPTEGAEWDSNTEYQYHNGGVTLNLAVFPEKLDVELGYLIEYGQEKTRAEGGTAAVNLPKVDDRLQAAYTTVSWHFTDRVTLRAGYRWESYHIKQFRDDRVPTGLVAGGNLFLGDVVGDYRANIFGISAVVEF
jgi:MtrB/PioB family decaheme-associated outer membrane protein